jgi:hypothetical protein
VPFGLISFSSLLFCADIIRILPGCLSRGDGYLRGLESEVIIMMLSSGRFRKKMIGYLCECVFTVFLLALNLLILTLIADISRIESAKQPSFERGESSSAIIKNLLIFN